MDLTRLLFCSSVLLFGLVSSQLYHTPRFPNLGSEIDPSIILGDPAEEGEIPFQAYLVSSRNNSNSGAICGGSLIRPNWVLTAAHCVVDTDRTQVGLGSVNRNAMTYSELSYERFPHELYNPLTISNDVALVKLPVNASGPNIATVEIAPASTGPLDGKRDRNCYKICYNLKFLSGEVVRASGFGRTMDGGPVSDILNKVNLTVITNQNCSATFGPLLIRRSTLCATWNEEFGESTCQGDSGGPLALNNGTSTMVVGVTSFGSSQGCASGAPSAYARVSAFNAWIERTIAANT